jgi:hypothetical protein
VGLKCQFTAVFACVRRSLWSAQARSSWRGPRSRGGAETRRKKSEGDDVEGGGRRSDSPVRPAPPKRAQFTVILRLPQPRLECWQVRKSNVAAEDAEGPPTYLRGRVVDGCRRRRGHTRKDAVANVADAISESIAALEEDHLPVPSEHFDTLVVAV